MTSAREIIKQKYRVKLSPLARRVRIMLSSCFSFNPSDATADEVIEFGTMHFGRKWHLTDVESAPIDV
jgi:hypothetical protein